MIDESAWAVTSPAAARQRREDALDIEIRQARALATVEESLARYFDGTSCRVGFAPAPLGGSEAWLDEELVPYVRYRYEQAGWKVAIEAHALVFHDPAALAGRTVKRL